MHWKDLRAGWRTRAEIPDPERLAGVGRLYSVRTSRAWMDRSRHASRRGLCYRRGLSDCAWPTQRNWRFLRPALSIVAVATAKVDEVNLAYVCEPE